MIELTSGPDGLIPLPEAVGVVHGNVESEQCRFSEAEAAPRNRKFRRIAGGIFSDVPPDLRGIDAAACLQRRRQAVQRCRRQKKPMDVRGISGEIEHALRARVKEKFNCVTIPRSPFLPHSALGIIHPDL